VWTIKTIREGTIMEKRIYLSTATMHGEEQKFIQEAFIFSM
jgi:hypothetical protein